MEGYLGETRLDIDETKYKNFTKMDWAMLWIEKYGSIDGSDHKDWLIDQIARIFKGTKMIVKLAKWQNGFQEVRFCLDEPSSEYLSWVDEMKNGEDGPDTYDYNVGVAP